MTLLTFPVFSMETIHVETIKMEPNENKTLTMPEYWRTYLTTAGHEMIIWTWTSSNPDVVRVSTPNKYSCSIHAQESAPTGARADIKCSFEYFEGVTIMSVSIYWTVYIDRNGSGGGGSGSESDPVFTGGIPTDDWSKSGNYSISWYNKNAWEYVISTNKELAGMAYLVNNNYTDFNGKTIRLSSDIDLSGKQWKPIGQKYENTFKGNFDGQGHTIFGIFIGKQEPGQTVYGFWGHLGGNVKNTNFEGDVFIYDPETPTYTENAFCVGGIAGRKYYSNTTISNCSVSMPIVFVKKNKYKLKNLYVGGVVGYSSGNISYCSHEGDFDVRQYVEDSEPCIVGGIAGYSYEAIDFCESISDNVYIYYPRADHSSDDLRFGGIVGEAGTKIKCCKSILGHVEIVNKTSATTYFYIGGISGKGSRDIVNSYSSISSAEFNSAYMYTGATVFGGICATNKRNSQIAATITACFSNSDVSVLSNYNLTYGNNGSTSFSSEQMKTNAFLEELNMYSMLEMDGPVWVQQEGGYPYIAKLHEQTSVRSPLADTETKQPVFSLSGQRITAPRKGVNIVGGKKVVVK